MDSWKETTDDGKTMNRPDRGQLNIWDRMAIDHYNKTDD